MKDYFKSVFFISMLLAVLFIVAMFVNQARADIYWVAGFGSAKARINDASGTQNPAWTQPYYGYEYIPAFDSNVWSVGFGSKINNRFSWEARYNRLGKAAVFGSWGCNDAGDVCGKTTYGYGSANSSSLSLSSITRIVGPDDFSVDAELGVHRWMSSWTTHYSNTGNPYAKNLLVHEPVKDRGVHLVYGLRVNYGAAIIALTQYRVEPRDGSFNKITALTLSFKF